MELLTKYQLPGLLQIGQSSGQVLQTVSVRTNLPSLIGHGGTPVFSWYGLMTSKW